MLPPRMCRGEALGSAADFFGIHVFVLLGNLPPTICPLLASVLLGMRTVPLWGMSWIRKVDGWVGGRRQDGQLYIHPHSSAHIQREPVRDVTVICHLHFQTCTVRISDQNTVVHDFTEDTYWLYELLQVTPRAKSEGYPTCLQAFSCLLWRGSAVSGSGPTPCNGLTPRNCWVLPWIRRQSSFDRPRRKRLPESSLWQSGLDRLGHNVCIPPRTWAHWGSASRGSPIR